MIRNIRIGAKAFGKPWRTTPWATDPNAACARRIGVAMLTLRSWHWQHGAVIYGPVTFSSRMISDSLAPIRIIGWLMFIFGGVALTLSTIGIYAMLSHGVAQGTHEIQ